MRKIGAALFKPKTCIQIGLFVGLALTIFKFLAGIWGRSQAMISDALHSLSDILTTVVVYIGVCIGARPADKDHPYGHGNAETIAATLVSLIILGIGLYAGFSTVLIIIQRSLRTPLTIALVAAIVSILTKEVLFHYTLKVGQMHNNPAVIADAWHHRSDAYSSVAALIGIIGARISLLYLDPLAGLVVAGLIIRIAARLIRANIGIIMDERPQAAFINNIKGIAREVGGVRNIDSVKVHRRGSSFTVDLEIAVDGNITVEAGHQVATNVRRHLLEQLQNIRDVMVHVNPVLSQNATKSCKKAWKGL